MHSSGIVPIQPIDKQAVEVVGKQQGAGMVIGKLFLNGAVESFKMRIHLGALGIGMVMRQAKLLQCLGEMLLEFRTVVGKDIGDGKRKKLNDLGKEFLGRQRCVAGRGPGKRHSGVDILTSDNIIFLAKDDQFNRIERYHVAGIQCFEMFGFP